MEQALSQYRLDLAEAVPLLASLLSLPLPEAEICFQQALAIARQEAKSLELWAATSLSRLWQ